jgi:hypothetical protein
MTTAAARKLAAPALLILSASAAFGQLQNPGFEIPGSTTIFAGWDTFENAVPEFGIVRTGAVSLKAYGNGGGAYNAAGAFQALSTSPGQSWEGAIHVLNSSTDPIQASNFAALNLEWLDAANGLISFVSSPAADAATPTDTWRRVTVSGTAPAGAVAVRIVPLHIQGPELAPGAVFFDDASLQPVTGGGVANPGFESGYAGWIPFGNAFIDEGFVHSGTRAAKMFGNWSGPYNATGCFQDFAAQPGERWIGRAFAATIASDRVGPGNFAVLNIEWRDATNNLISFVSSPAVDEFTAPDVWNQVTVDAIAPTGTVVARIVLLHIQGPSLSGGAVWWDDVEFGRGTVNPPCDPDVNQDGNVDQDDVSYLINVVGGGENPTGIDPDFNQDGNVDQDDIAALINVVAGGDCP